jgi:hypothetical protein
MKKRKNYTSGFKTKVVLEALQERSRILKFLSDSKEKSHPIWMANSLIFRVPRGRLASVPVSRGVSPGIPGNRRPPWHLAGAL